VTPTQKLFAALWRSAALMIVIILVGAATPLVIDQIEGPSYTATGEVLVQVTDIVPIALGLQNPPTEDPTRQISDVALVARSEQFLTILAVKLGRPASAWQIVGRELSVSPATDADSLGFTAQRGSRAAAIQLATTAVEQLVSYYPSVVLPSDVAGAANAGDVALQQALARLRLLESLQPTVTVYNRPTSAKRVRPARTRDLAIGLVAGVIVAFIVVALREALDDKIRDARELAEIFEVPVLLDPLGRDLLRLTDLLADFRAGPQGEVVVLLSPTEGDGRTALAGGIADALGTVGQRADVVDARGAGMRDPVPVEAWAGPAPSPQIRFDSRVTQLADRIRATARDHDVVLLPVPGVLGAGGARRAVALSDVAVVVIRLGVSSRRDLHIFRHQIEPWNDRLAAVLVSGAR